MSIDVAASSVAGANRVLTADALSFVGELHSRFEETRRSLMASRTRRQEKFDDGERPDFLAHTAEIRNGDWKVADQPVELRDRRVELTGPTERKMVINALNSGASVFMADFEDANSPTWKNMVEGQVNLSDAVRRIIDFDEGSRSYELAQATATLFVRPRGWHLVERHLEVSGAPVAGALFDAGLYVFGNASELLSRESGPYFYLPKLESHEEARLWNDVFVFCEDRLGIPPRSIKATVLIETITAAFEMEEILYELRDHSAGLNAGRWDYIFSIIKKFRHDPAFVLPDRSDVGMRVPFMRAYAEALVQACHRRGAPAIGGMSAFIPSRRDPTVNERALPVIVEDKRREGAQGFDGAWVAHPDLVPVVREVFDEILGDRPNQIDRLREDVDISADDLLDVTSAGRNITDDGLRANIAIGIQYIESWLNGQGAVGLFNLMEDTATAEISRSQIWQWIRHNVRTSEGRSVDRARVRTTIEDEMKDILGGNAATDRPHLDQARMLFEQLVLADEFVEFMTVPGSVHLNTAHA
ncbi:MAG TPA: malate synthase A [Acidimicrobiia bacterium]|nr:malate synthase A [Acidimicrobiia bacterium]